ncbi:MAG TPA: oligopeptide ABC transporter permease [Chloroflexia bacterium]|nr:oligopeptide ABC transporter permease [Chloroflexia bacterium]
MNTLTRNSVEQPQAGDELKGQKVESPFRKALRRFLRHRLALAGTIILLLLVFTAVFAGQLTGYGPETIDLLNRSQPPSPGHWFGTDRIGRDVFSRTLYGGRASLEVGVGAVVISIAIGALLGSIAGFWGGFVGGLIMRFTDMIMAFPPIIITLVAATIFGISGEDSLWKTTLLIGLLNWPVPCRLVRAKLLSIREQDYVLAARALGVKNGRILFKHALPNSIDVLIVYSSLGIANAILLEAGLSFLGLGVQPPTPSWGNMLNPARNVSILEQYPWQWLPAGIAIVLAVLAVNFIGDGLRDALDPRARK